MSMQPFDENFESFRIHKRESLIHFHHKIIHSLDTHDTD